jgi:hypothetical protein
MKARLMLLLLHHYKNQEVSKKELEKLLKKELKEER